MPQEPLENESQLVSRDPWVNWGLRNGVQVAMEMEGTVDLIINVTINAVISPEEPGEGGNMRNQKVTLSVRMSLDEALGYVGGQRLAHERSDLTVLAIDQFSNASWHAMRRSRFDQTQYRAGFHEGYLDELNGLAQPLPL